MPELDNSDLSTPRTLLDELIRLRQDVQTEASAVYASWLPVTQPNRPEFAPNARNLAAYLALRKRDLRHLQVALRPWGLSSLGRIEAQVMPNLEAVIATLALIADAPASDDLPQRPSAEAFIQGGKALDAETDAVFGPRPTGRRVRMMVTLPTQAAHDAQLVQDMLTHGMNVARINCAHDTPDEWARMIAHVRRAEAEVGRPCKIAMDLGGPKSRTADMIKPHKHRVHKGDVILLTSEPPQPNDAYPLQIRCTLPQALEQVQVGHAVWFDDGKIGAQVTAKTPDGVVLKVTLASDDGDKLKDDKGINFPQTELNLNPLTPKDLQDLDFVAVHADIINYSFVQTAEDIRLLQAELAKRQPNRTPAIVAKIETAKAVRHLPEIIVAAGAQQPVGIMIARGDLAVELGFERLAEIQEEILWICEAAHVPVIWATQVLETLAKEGRPSRAEVTDAAMAERAECVMLNKGPYILEAMHILDSILARMGEHQSKKVAMLRALRSWG